MSRQAPRPEEAAADDLAGTTVPASDRAITPVRTHLGSGRGKVIVLAALVVGSATLLGMTWDRERVEADAPRDPARQIIAFEETDGHASGPTLAKPGPRPPRLTSDPTSTVPAIELNDARALTEDRPTRRAEPDKAPPLLVYSRGSRRLSEPVPPRITVSEGSTEIDRLRQGSDLSVLRAGRLPNRNFLILAGTNLPCVLLTALDSTVPGYVSCITPRDVLSDNGATVLLEKGTRVLGEHQSAMRQGQSRIFVLWTRAVTPSGVVVALASPAADALGRAGFDGEVDSRFWARFGGALALSLVDDGAYAALGSTNEHSRLPSDAAAAALEGSLGVRPVLRMPQGGEVSIFVAHDLDFSNVYSLRSH